MCRTACPVLTEFSRALSASWSLRGRRWRQQHGPCRSRSNRTLHYLPSKPTGVGHVLPSNKRTTGHVARCTCVELCCLDPVHAAHQACKLCPWLLLAECGAYQTKNCAPAVHNLAGGAFTQRVYIYPHATRCLKTRNYCEKSGALASATAGSNSDSTAAKVANPAGTSLLFRRG